MHRSYTTHTLVFILHVHVHICRCSNCSSALLELRLQILVICLHAWHTHHDVTSGVSKYQSPGPSWSCQDQVCSCFPKRSCGRSLPGSCRLWRCCVITRLNTDWERAACTRICDMDKFRLVAFFHRILLDCMNAFRGIAGSLR
jgi:hypothetical protein